MADTQWFLTGATGLLGTEVVSQLLHTTDAAILVLVRAATADAAAKRLRSLWCDDPTLSAAVGRRVVPVVGDITGTAPEGGVLDAVTHVVHCAAETGVQQSREELWRINVEGTRHVAEWAAAMPRLKRFTYVSTAYVAGTRSGIILENDPLPGSFYSLYEQSKAQAERVVRATSLPLTVCRPGMIVGNSQTGRTRNFNTVYYVLKLMLQGKLPLLPIARRQTVNVVPVDYVARQVVALTLHPEAEGQTFHLVAPHAELPQAGQLAAAVAAWAKANLQTALRQPLCLPLPLLRTVGRRYNAGAEAKRHSLLSNLTALMPYFLDDHVFDRSNTDRLTGPYTLQWTAFLPVLLAFACRHNFMRLTDDSIFQQAMRRRQSRHYPITYYNITAHGTDTVTGAQMNAIVAAYGLLLARLGVKAADRVALTGINCAEHAAIDCAIGLREAVSVPIYYTTPPDELSLLLSKSGARWLFVGDERVWNALEARLTTTAGGSRRLTLTDGTTVEVIAFGPLKGRTGTTATGPRDADTADTVSMATTDGTALATIRYTSGTTGEPKGVMFSYNQLKWMGQVLTNLLSWPDRNSEMRYLSFLPMSHVVEGILAAYAPYCMLCRAKIFYLNDFQMLTRALPQVRPTVFFSVPRFYEKLWEQIEQSALGRRYLSLGDGWLRTLTGRLLRRGVLRRAGLDRCSQLLVGSAPISEELLLRFRRLGIEIHNAYGQTEAPLITLNRLGHNVIASVGTPLPDTTVGTAPDGELLVEGPQVAMGYYGLTTDTFSRGTLHTGDLGRVDTDGSVYIEGRKKDMLITSYGKNINCTKIEQLLCGISNVEQAVLVGEQRPFCTALLWTTGADDSLHDDIGRMNQTLSHPEQVKRWLVVKTPLSIAKGELTPNLKVKRAVVWQHYSEAIASLYI